MNSSTINGQMYVFRLKYTDANDWDAPDVVHGLAHQGDGCIAFHNFKDISKKNRKLFLCKKVATPSEDECSEDILDGMESWKAIGTPKLSFMDAPATWYTVAKSAYDAGIFTNKEAFAELEASQKGAGITSKSSPNDEHKALLEKVRRQAGELSKFKRSSLIDNFTQSERQLAGLSPDDPNASSGSPPPDWNKLAIEEILEVADEWRRRAIESEDRNIVLEEALTERDEKIYNLEEKFKTLKTDLDVSKKAQAGFMAASDRKTLEAELVKKASASIFDSLKPLIASEINPIRLSLDSVSSSLDDIKTSCSKIDTLQDHVKALGSEVSGNANLIISQVEAAEGASSEILASIQEKLAAGPATVFSSPPPPVPVHDGECTYKAVQGSTGSLRCTLGCSNTISTVGGNTPSAMKTVSKDHFTPHKYHQEVAGNSSERFAGRGRGRGRGVIADRGGDADWTGAGRGRGGSTKRKNLSQNQRKKNKALRSLQFEDNDPAAGQAAHPNLEGLQQQLRQLQQQLQAKLPK